MRKLLMTIAIGNDYQQLSQHTHPLMKQYAERIGADFLSIDQKQISLTTPHFEKFQISHLLNKYHRIIYLDTDIIVRPDCPNLFDIVPYEQLGAFNEGPYTDRIDAMRSIMEQCNTKVKWEGQYYNSGVMVISRRHKHIFHKPAGEISNFFEQSYLNLMFIKKEVKMYNLSYKFNRMTALDRFTGEHRLASYLVHYAGCPNVNSMLDVMTKDINKWEKDHPSYNYKRNIAIHVHGGLGDEICAEPAIRYIVEKAYVDSNVHIITWYPRLYIHLPVPVHMMGQFKGDVDEIYFQINTMAAHGDLAWKYISPNLTHNTDYSSLMCLRKIIPDVYKQPKLQINQEDLDEIDRVVGKSFDWSNTVIVHPGRGWPSKTFPKWYWDEIILKLSNKYKVVVIGKDISNEQGTVPVEIPEGVVDLRNILSLGGLIALISKGNVLITNDSSPVHIAGAFNNWIILLPTCKHPDHVLPYRNGNRSYKAKALYKKLTCEDNNIDDRPTQLEMQLIDKEPSNWMEFLPDVDTVVDEVDDMLVIIG